tara:strand:+ start:7312 stop:7650 length:339 start_codon:yes stop_codon:yes gene_type:complete
MWRPILIYSAVFTVLFVSHIIAAAKDLQLIFQVIAALITIQTLFAGLILHLLRGNILHVRGPVVVLSAGLGWAYAGMEASWNILLWVVSAIMIHILTERGLKYVTPVDATDG